MSVTNKIKALMRMHGKKNFELVEHLGLVRPQALTNKYSRGSFSCEDLIRIAAFLDCELAFIALDTQKITLEVSDILESRITNKIKALLQMHGKKNTELAEYLGFAHQQTLINKFKRGSFSAEDLIKFAAFLDCELVFITSDAQKITLNTSDIRENCD